MIFPVTPWRMDSSSSLMLTPSISGTKRAPILNPTLTRLTGRLTLTAVLPESTSVTRTLSQRPSPGEAVCRLRSALASAASRRAPSSGEILRSSIIRRIFNRSSDVAMPASLPEVHADAFAARSAVHVNHEIMIDSQLMVER
jgi:hypothetical protein